MGNIRLQIISAVLILGFFVVSDSYADKAADIADAQKLAATDDLGPEVVRGEIDMRDVMRPHPDTDVLDTALVFTNPHGKRTVVACTAVNANGQRIGRAFAVVPPRGLRFILASDIANDQDFVGSAICRSRSRLIPSAFVLGAGFSDAPTNIVEGWDRTSMRFPVVASY